MNSIEDSAGIEGESHLDFSHLLILVDVIQAAALSLERDGPRLDRPEP